MRGWRARRSCFLAGEESWGVVSFCWIDRVGGALRRRLSSIREIRRPG